MKEISKEKFVSIMETIKKEYNHVIKVNSLLNQIFEDGGGYPQMYCYNELVELLKFLFNDDNNDSIIDYYIYELDFGKDWYKGCITVNKEDIDISNSEKLYEYLIKNKNDLD